MTKTLDGKTAGFQAAKELREEIEAHKQRDAELFNKVIFFIMQIYKSTINSFVEINVKLFRS